MKWCLDFLQNNPGMDSRSGSEQGIDAARLALNQSFITLNDEYWVNLDIIFSTFVDD